MKDSLFSAYISMVYGAAVKEVAITHAVIEESGFMDDPDATTGDRVVDTALKNHSPVCPMESFLAAVHLAAEVHDVDTMDRKAMTDVAASVSAQIVQVEHMLRDLLIEKAALNGGIVGTGYKLAQVMSGAIPVKGSDAIN